LLFQIHKLYRYTEVELTGAEAREAAAKRVLKTVANAGDAYDILNVSPTDTAGVVGLYKCVLFYYKSFLLPAVQVESNVTRSLKSAWFQPLNHLKCDFLVSKICFFKCNLCRYTSVKKAFWKLSLMVHPDKCDHPQAAEAFDLVKKAHTRWGCTR
jgi:hypothetical protein